MVLSLLIFLIGISAFGIALKPAGCQRRVSGTSKCLHRTQVEVPRRSPYTNMMRLYMGGQMLEFRPEKDNDSFESTVVSAEIGAELSEVAEAAEIPIAYKCRKGECGTCEVNLNGKWVRTCQTQVPAMSKDEDLVVIVKKIKKKPAKFFSPKSFAEGVFNNGLGVAGFVWRGARSGKEFRSRMEREQEVEALVAKRKSEKANSNM